MEILPGRIWQITDKLYQGGRCGIHQQLPADLVTAVVDLDCSYPPYPDVLTIRMQIEDFYYPGDNWLKNAVGLINVLIEHEHSVLVHCHAGISRSAMLAIGYLMCHESSTFMNFDAARKLLFSKNQNTDPSSWFVSGLRDFEAAIEDDPRY